MQLEEILTAALQDFIKTERQAKTPGGLLNTFKAEAIGEIFKFVARQDWKEIAEQNREAQRHDA